MTQFQKLTTEELEYTHKFVEVLKSFKDMGIEFEDAINLMMTINGKDQKESTTNITIESLNASKEQAESIVDAISKQLNRKQRMR